MLSSEANGTFSVPFTPFCAQFSCGTASQGTPSSLPAKPAFRKGSEKQIYIDE